MVPNLILTTFFIKNILIFVYSRRNPGLEKSDLTHTHDTQVQLLCMCTLFLTYTDLLSNRNFFVSSLLIGLHSNVIVFLIVLCTGFSPVVHQFALYLYSFFHLCRIYHHLTLFIVHLPFSRM